MLRSVVSGPVVFGCVAPLPGMMVGRNIQLCSTAVVEYIRLLNTYSAVVTAVKAVEEKVKKRLMNELKVG